MNDMVKKESKRNLINALMDDGTRIAEDIGYTKQDCIKWMKGNAETGQTVHFVRPVCVLVAKKSEPKTQVTEV